MPIENCLITAAGFGTRMGEIGKIIPKPLWPIFEKTLLELQILFVKKLGVKNIFINTHHMFDHFKIYEEIEGVKILHEEKILGSGGCVHNLINKYPDLKDALLIINSDQFFFFDFDKLFTDAKNMIDSKIGAHLFSIPVEGGEKYNETVVKNNKLVDIRESTKECSYLTYSGVGLINLNELSYFSGESSFFSTVCDYRKRDVLMTCPEKQEFWDFGTAKKYLENSFKIISSTESELYKFLVSENGIIESKITNFGYLEKNKIVQYNNMILSRDNYEISWHGINQKISSSQ